MEREALRDLKDLSSWGGLTILPTDMGNATVVMESAPYTSKLGVLLQEDNYWLLPRNPTSNIEKQVHEALKWIESEGNLPGTLKMKLIPRQSTMPQSLQASKHSQRRVPLHPIVCTIGSPTYALAKELARILSPLTRGTSSFMKNSTHCRKNLHIEDWQQWPFC